MSSHWNPTSWYSHQNLADPFPVMNTYEGWNGGYATYRPWTHYTLYSRTSKHRVVSWSSRITTYTAKGQTQGPRTCSRLLRQGSKPQHAGIRFRLMQDVRALTSLSNRYNNAHNLFCKLAPLLKESGTWNSILRPLNCQDIRAMSDLLWGETEGTKKLSWIWCVSGVADGKETTLEGRCIPTSIIETNFHGALCPRYAYWVVQSSGQGQAMVRRSWAPVGEDAENSAFLSMGCRSLGGEMKISCCCRWGCTWRPPCICSAAGTH